MPRRCSAFNSRYRAGLSPQVVQPAFQFLPDIAQTIKVFHRAPHPVLGLAPAFPVLRNASGFLQVSAQILRFGFDQLADHALLDDGIAARSETRTEEDVDDVATTTPASIQIVGGVRIPRNFPPYGNASETRIFAAEAAVGVVEGKLD